MLGKCAGLCQLLKGRLARGREVTLWLSYAVFAINNAAAAASLVTRGSKQTPCFFYQSQDPSQHLLCLPDLLAAGEQLAAYETRIKALVQVLLQEVWALLHCAAQ